MFWKFIRSLLFALPAESAHEFAFDVLKLIQKVPGVCEFLSDRCAISNPRLNCRVFGLDFPNPVGLAAGFDKNGRLLPIWLATGFGFAEVGTVTALAQPGNPRPRLFRFPDDGALINRLGFNNDGAQMIRDRLLALKESGRWPRFPVGINVGKSKVTPLNEATGDYAKSVEALSGLADYLVLNVSSPNTPGLRDLQEKGRLAELLERLQDKNPAPHSLSICPLLVKISPDLDWAQLDDMLEVCFQHGVAGVIATNTTLGRVGLAKPTGEAGGLSGRPLQTRSTECIRHIYQKTGGKLPIIGVGGVFTAEDAYEKIRAGASLLQAYTGFVYGGPTFARRINEGIIARMDRDGFANVSEVVGRG